ncbi:hypothetical protein GBA52_026740 [Prunus armeniaca]|nr:hypothetical protein GBA52_026740 [Prunus armeniaca]
MMRSINGGGFWNYGFKSMIEKGEEKRRIDRGKDGTEETKLESNVCGIGATEIGIYYLPGTVRYGMTPNGITNLEPVSCQTVTG